MSDIISSVRPSTSSSIWPFSMPETGSTDEASFRRSRIPYPMDMAIEPRRDGTSPLSSLVRLYIISSSLSPSGTSPRMCRPSLIRFSFTSIM